tara:strand:+ start:719 stop:868 length:150 start_codon:yes stop_codon:yes gene_type:complete
MPTLRFLGYIEVMNNAAREQNKSPLAKKVDGLKGTMSAEDNKNYKEEYG